MRSKFKTFYQPYQVFVFFKYHISTGVQMAEVFKWQPVLDTLSVVGPLNKY